jgi:phage gpG-like protein
MKIFASEEFKKEILEELGKEGLSLIGEEFANEHDPYGKAWALLKKSRSGGGILNKTGKLKDSFGFEVDSNSIKFSNPTEYASYHQNGTSKLEQRAMLPYNAAPEEWLERFKEIVERKMQEVLNR